MKELVVLLLISINIVAQRPLPLENFSNSCYLNSITQSMYALKPLTNYLANLHNPYQNGSIAYDYISLIYALNTQIFSIVGNEATYAKELKAFSSKGARLTEQRCDAVGSQQDASEFLGKFIDSLSETNNTKIQNDMKVFFESKRLVTQDCPSINVTLSRTESKETYLNLPTAKDKELVTISKNPSKKDFLEDLTSLNDCLKQEFKQEIFLRTVEGYEGEQKCSKITTLESTPDILIFTLRRYYYIFHKLPKPQKPIQLTGKNDHSITIPFEINIAEYVTKAQSNDPFYDYELIAAAAHSGTTAGGHFVAYVKYPSGWWYCSDTTIEWRDEAEIKNSINKNAYILFYQRKKLTEQILPPQQPSEHEELMQALTNLTNSLESLEMQLQKS